MDIVENRPAEETLNAAPVAVTAPVQPTPAEAAPELAGPSRQTLTTALVGAVCLIIGLVAGGLLFGGGTDPQALSSIIRSVVADELARSGSGGGPSNVELADDDPFFGSEDAAITIVEFSDFYCSFCGRFADQTLPRLREEYGDRIRFVYRDMPIIGGQASVQAAIAANCAENQGKFWEFHDALFANNGARDRAAFVSFASEMGMDTAAFETCLDDRAMADEVTLDLLDGQALGITGTPAFYINGRFVSGAQPFETFALLIDAELNKLEGQ